MKMLPFTPVGGQVTKTFAPSETAHRVRNFERSEEGGFRSIRGPIPYVPNYGSGYPTRYGRMWGLYHTRLGERDILLLHSADKLLIHRGYNAGNTTTVWEVLKSGLPSTQWTRQPTQFATDGKRVFIATGLDQPIYCYDGVVFDTLGYVQRPASPSVTISVDEPLTTYSLSSGGLGTVAPDYGTDGGLLSGAYNYYVQFMDRWGDLSAESGAGTAAIASEQAGSAIDLSTLLKGAIVSLPLGPDKTRARRVFRSPDAVNGGSVQPFEIYGSLADLADAPVVPDNSTTVYMDTLPDAYLGQPMERLRPVPRGDIIAMAFGRLFVAGVADEPGFVYYSKPGQAGTFGILDYLLPDPQGQVRGLARCSKGLLVLTEDDAFLVIPSATGSALDFQVLPIPGGQGCLAPDSIRTLPTGQTVWLGRGGFYAFNDTVIERISDPIRKGVERIDKGQMVAATAAVNPRTGAYLCAVNDGSTLLNNIILCLDADGWHERTDVNASALCSTADHRGLVLAAGAVSSTTALWVLDHEGYGYTPPSRTAFYESNFLWAGTEHRVTVQSIVLMLREGSTGTATLKTYRDGDRSTVADTFTFPVEYQHVAAPVWNTTLYNASGATWQDRKAYQKRVDVSIPACESFAWRLEYTGDIELVGWSAIMQPAEGPPGAMVPR